MCTDLFAQQVGEGARQPRLDERLRHLIHNAVDGHFQCRLDRGVKRVALLWDIQALLLKEGPAVLHQVVPD